MYRFPNLSFGKSKCMDFPIYTLGNDQSGTLCAENDVLAQLQKFSGSFDTASFILLL